MKKSIQLFQLVLLVSIMMGCTKKEKLSQANETVKMLFSAIKADDQESMIKYYPNISLFDSYYKSDSISINSTEFINDSLISVKVLNQFTNGFGKKSDNDIILYLLPDSLNQYIEISDSKGLTDHKENELYSFAMKIGCIDSSDTTDIQLLKKFSEAYILSLQYRLELLLDFTKNVRVVSWDWETGYGGSASGKGIVRNNTSFRIPDVQYVIKYMDRSGSVITTDDGYVSYDNLYPNESKAFTFYTSYVGNAYKASISLSFDEDMIKDYVLNSKEYEGNEFQMYLDSLKIK